MLKRILVAIPIVIIVALALFVQGWVLAIFAVALALLAQFEIVRAMDGNGKPVVRTVSFLFAGILAVLFLLAFGSRQAYGQFTQSYFTPGAVLTLFVILTMATFVAAMFSKRHTAQSVSNTLLTLVYPQMIMVLFYALILTVGYPSYVHDWFNVANSYDGPYVGQLIMLLMVFLPAMFSDTFAYFFGMALGKRKLCPQISPKKTVAGCVAGIIGGVIAALLIWLVFDNMVYLSGHYIEMGAFVNYAVAGGILAAISQLGDLSASFLKRSLGIKDFGKLLPGHGGVLDRIDSVLFCIPVVYLLMTMTII